MIYADGALGKVIALRLSPGEDLFGGVVDACTGAGIVHGVILTGIGSLNGARVLNPTALPDKKAGYGYGDELVLKGPIELLSMSGEICKGPDGAVAPHIHVSLSDEWGHSFGGHLVTGSKVLLTAEIVIAQLTGIHMNRVYDDDLEVYLLAPESAR